MAKYGYDPKVDYSKGISEAVAAGDLARAGILEAQRNEKIRGEGLTQYQTTSHYADYLPKSGAAVNGASGSAANYAGGSTWSYDLNSDPAWQALRKQYLREADRGTRDTMASYAGMTGGVPSTAAVTAAQQAGDYHRAQLADRIPELMQNSYSRYMQQRQQEAQEQQAAADLEYRQWQQQQAEQQAAADLEYRKWQQAQAEKGSAYDKAMTWIQMGLMPSDADLAAAGIDKASAQKYVTQAQAAMAAKYSGGGGSSSKGGTRSSSTESKGSTGGDNTGGKKETANTAPKVDPKTNSYNYERILRQINAVKQSGVNNNSSKRVEDEILRAYNQGLIDEETANKLGAQLDSLWLNP